MARGTRAAANLALLLAAGLGLWAVPGAFAQGGAPLTLKPRVLVVAVGLDAASQPQALRLARHAEQALIRAERFEVVRLADALDPDGARARAGKLQDADSAFQAGMQAYDGLDTQKAVGLFDKAVKGYEQTDLTRTFPNLIRAWTMRIASHVANGDVRVARAEVDRLLPLSPKAEFSSRYFPPEELAYVEKVRRSLGGLSNASMAIKSAPALGQVYVDGQFRGVSPLSLQRLAAADHYVTVISPGYALQQERARDGSVEVTLRPTSSFREFHEYQQRIANNPREEARDDAARELGQWLGVNQVLVAIAAKSSAGARLDVTALRIDVADGHNAAYAEQELPLEDGLGPAADAFFGTLTPVDAPRAGGPVTHFTGGGSARKRTVGYVLLGTGVALVGGGIASALHARNEQRLFSVTPQTDTDNSSRHERTGRTFAILADVFTAGGLVLAGTGTYFAFFSGSSDGAQDGASSGKSKASELPMPPPPPGTTPRTEPRPRSSKDEHDLRED